MTVANIRLQCGDKIKWVIEAQYCDCWADLSVQEALDAVEAILKKSSNPAKERSKFHLLYQYDGESGKEFLHHCEQQALECDFRCTHRQGDLSEDFIRDRVLTGLSNEMLKLEIHQNFEKYKSLEQLTSNIEGFESAKVSAQRSRASEVSPVATDSTALPALEETAGGDAAVLAAQQHTY